MFHITYANSNYALIANNVDKYVVILGTFFTTHLSVLVIKVVCL